MSLSRLIALFILVMTASISRAQDEPQIFIWVRAGDLTETKPDVVIGPDILEKNSTSTLAEVLSSVAGVYVPVSGPRGQFQSISIQGSKSEHTLVLLDGVSVNDVSSPSGGFDFSIISPSLIERIEVFKGPRAVQFGSQAFSGVINLILKKPASAVGKADASVAASTENAFSAQVSGQASVGEKTSLLLSGSHFQEASQSTASSEYGNTEVDAVRKWSSLGSLVSDIGSGAWRLTQFHTQGKNDYDYSGGPNGDDPNARASHQFYLTQASLQKSFAANSGYELRLYSKSFTRYENDPADSAHNTFLQSKYASSLNGLLLQTYFSPKPSLGFFTGFELSNENLDVRSDGSFSTDVRSEDRGEQALFLFLNWRFAQDWLLTPGVRGECEDSHCVLQRELNLQWRQWTLRGAKAFRSPTFYQLYSFYGDENLRSEEVDHLSLNLRTSLRDVEVELQAYRNFFHELIDYNFVTQKYVNQAKVETFGVDVSLLQETRFFSNQMALSYGEAKDKQTNLTLLRRPKYHVFFQSLWRASESWQLGPNVAYRSSVEDIDNTSTRIQLDAATRVGAFIDYRFNSQTQASLKINNMFDDKTPDVWGYSAPLQEVWIELKSAW